MQLIEDGNYYILIDYLYEVKPYRKTHCYQWEIAEINRGHIKFLNHKPLVSISVKELIDKKTPIVKIPDADKLRELLTQYKDNPLGLKTYIISFNGPSFLKDFSSAKEAFKWCNEEADRQQNASKTGEKIGFSCNLVK